MFAKHHEWPLWLGITYWIKSTLRLVYQPERANENNFFLRVGNEPTNLLFTIRCCASTSRPPQIDDIFCCLRNPVFDGRTQRRALFNQMNERNIQRMTSTVTLFLQKFFICAIYQSMFLANRISITGYGTSLTINDYRLFTTYRILR